MIEKLCKYITAKIREDDKNIDDVRAEEINYGLECLIGELPKGIIILLISYFLGLLELVFISSIVFQIYRAFAGGIHLKSNISCLLISGILVIGSVYLAQKFIYENKYLIYTIISIFNLIIAYLYAPSDTYNRPIINEKQRIKQKFESYFMIIFIYILATFLLKEQAISNVVIYSITIESLMITPIAYKLFNNRYGSERKDERGELIC